MTPQERAIVLRILNEIVPDREVRAFGSRVTGKAKPFSDLDLAIMGDEPLSLETRARLEEAFSESELPWKVDVLDWPLTEEGFQKAIEESSLCLRKANSILARHASNFMNTQPQHLSPYKSQIASLGELADNSTGSIAIGPFGSRMKADCYVSSGMPVIRGTNLVHGRKWTGDWVYVPLELADTMPNCQVTAGDIVFPHRGAIGEVGIVPDDGNTYLISSSLMKIKLDRTKSDPNFIYYYFSSQAGREEIMRFSSSVGTPGIGQPLTSMRQFKIPFLPLQIQKSISFILSSLDDKIDLNRRMNETLEAMARALFRDWFVDFGPTRAKMAREAPYLTPELWELFPDRLDDEGKPEGWHQKPISEHFSVSIGKTPPRKEREHFVSSGHGIPWLSIRDMGTGNVFVSTTSENLTPESVERFNIKIASEGTVLLSFKLTVGRVMIANQRISTNEAIAHLFSKKVPTNYTYCYLKNFDFDTLGSTSSIATAVNSQTIRDMPFLIPSNSILDEFSLITERIFEKLFINEKENNNLSQFRDLLLPKLMSGEISVRDAEKMVEDAA